MFCAATNGAKETALAGWVKGMVGRVFCERAFRQSLGKLARVPYVYIYIYIQKICWDHDYEFYLRTCDIVQSSNLSTRPLFSKVLIPEA